MSSHYDDDKSRKHIPSWDGNPVRWLQFKDEVRIWKLGENLDVTFSLAARLVGNLRGAARRVTISMPDAELAPEHGSARITRRDADGNEEVIHEEVVQNLAQGIDNVMEKLRTQLRPEPVVSKAESLAVFFKTQRYHRRSGCRMSEYVSVFDEGVTRLQNEGVEVSALGPVLGWFFMEMAGLNHERRERCAAALRDENYELNDVKRTCVRLFPEIHRSEPRPDPASFGAKGNPNRPPCAPRVIRTGPLGRQR